MTVAEWWASFSSLQDPLDQALLTILAATTILVVAVVCTAENKSKSSYSLLPGPSGLPLLGSLWEVAQPRVHQTIAAWAARFGPVFKFRLLGKENVVLSNPADFAHFLNRGPQELPKAPHIYSPIDKIYSPRKVPSFFTTRDPDAWLAVRKGCAPAFSPENIRKSFPVIRDTVAAVCAGLERQLAVGQGAGEGVDMADAALRVALDVAGLTLFAHDFHARDYSKCKVLEAIPPLLAEFSARALDPLRVVKHTLMPWSRDASRFRRNLRTAYGLWAQLAQEVRQVDLAAEAEGNTSLRVCLAKLDDPKTGLPLTDAQLAPQAAAFLVAGFETTAHSTAWALYEIALNPEVQAKLGTELEREGLLWAPGKPGKELEQAHLASLSFLDQVWREALRMHPVGSIGPVREADREVALPSGVRIPKGTALWLSICAVHSSPYNWVDPERFWPERWLHQEGAGEGGKMQAGQQEPPPRVPSSRFSVPGQPTPAGNTSAPGRSFMAFSYGPRDCLGQALANLEGKAMLAMLCSRFEFGVAQRMGSPEAVRAAEVNRLTMQSGVGIWLTIKRRGSSE